jgi:hypothetical protein
VFASYRSNRSIARRRSEPGGWAHGRRREETGWRSREIQRRQVDARLCFLGRRFSAFVAPVSLDRPQRQADSPLLLLVRRISRSLERKCLWFGWRPWVERRLSTTAKGSDRPAVEWYEMLSPGSILRVAFAISLGLGGSDSPSPCGVYQVIPSREWRTSPCGVRLSASVFSSLAQVSTIARVRRQTVAGFLVRSLCGLLVPAEGFCD